jgi:hypothetical protein
MEINMRIHEKQSLLYVPRIIRNVLGTNIKAVPTRSAVLFFSEKTSIDEALASLDIIRADLLHAKTLQKTSYPRPLRQETPE